MARCRAIVCALGALLLAALVANASAGAGRAATGARATSTTPVAPVLWTAPAAVDDAPIDAIACPSKTMCVAVDRDGDVLTSTDPAAAAPNAWQVADVDGTSDLSGIACPSIALCVAVDAGGDAVTSTDPLGGAAAWHVVKIDDGSNVSNSDTAGAVLLRGVSCPSASLCVAVDADGDALVSEDPTGPAVDWASTHVDTNHRSSCTRTGLACQSPLVGIACPSSTLCAAADFASNVLTSTDPTTAAPWTSTSTDDHGLGSLWGLSCPTTSFCAAVNGSGRDVMTFRPLHVVARRTTSLGASATAIWCRSTSLCLAAAETPGGLAVLLGSTDPGAAQPTWTSSPLGGVDGVACPSVTICLAVDDEGEVAAGVQTSQLGRDERSELLATDDLPSVATLSRTHTEPVAFTSPIAAVARLTWAVTESSGATLTVATAKHHYTGPGAGTLVLRLTSAGRKLFRTAQRKVTVQATATFSASTGSLTRTRTLTLRLGRRATHTRGRVG